ncbi:hypothetical protein GCM10011588_68380 [Nocardia jinanensis]|uniref:Uncharacterized protein n=1 Tax=Nocardia jinanensis TaxID=382504 RepID=A0A917RY09_9NOCA|nr:hypothetical protein GCM10011588_68380 [Nocardia jinanensis]
MAGEPLVPDSPKAPSRWVRWWAAVVDGCSVGSFVLELFGLWYAVNTDASQATILLIIARLASVLLTRGYGS